MVANVHFSKPEFDRRLAAVKSRMERERLDALVVTAPSNMYYVTGYDGWSFHTPQVVGDRKEVGGPARIDR